MVDDIVQGPVVFQNDELDDLIIVRSDGSPTYNFCVVVDDATMAITHVIRGDDHLANTPKQILIYQALGYPVPRVRATCRSSSASTARGSASATARPP